MEPRKRMKASDVARNAEYLIPRKMVSFWEAFPAIADIAVEVEESGIRRRFVRDSENTRYVYDMKNPPSQFVNCSNPLCYNGGIEIGNIIRFMTWSHETEKQGKQRCQGYEGSPKGRRKYDICDHYFSFKISIKYKDDN